MNRMTRNPNLFMPYYTAKWELILGGMEERVNEIEAPKNAYYVPHHPVFKDSTHWSNRFNC